MRVLREVLLIVQEEFYGELPDSSTLNYAAIRGLLGALDDENTTFIEPNSAAILGEDATGQLEGIGAYVGFDEESRLEIIRPFADGPADLAGLRAGDRILSVDDLPLAGRSIHEAIALIRGPEGTDVRLLIMRTGVLEPFEVVVTRARIEIPTTATLMTDDGVGYVRLYTFNASARSALEGSLSELLAQDPVGIILDLRQNPGGWLDQAISVADLFLAEGVILVERWSDGAEDVYRARLGDLGERVPLVVLVDAGSASASEIVGGALQDNGRAVLIGESTYGKGSVQRPHALSDGSELRVTIALWFTPGGQAIDGHGLTPDIEVLWPDDGVLATGDDPQLEQAIEYLLDFVE
jgi:carboxyl-terminal processing protease